ncbi:uncharacterized protein LOC134764003 [Penaeus indicus]|uniref:uncharacterized protein LOC134764003 n=1 Tax=Penaeus indicus TaxID=29960 RepID=UPI00300BFF61
MTPIQIEKSYDVKASSTPTAKCSRQARSSSRSWDVFLPISRRGSFFQDSFFSDIHKDFDSSVREVLARWSDEDLKVKDFRRDDIMDRYRQLRSRNLNEGNQAVTVTSDNTSHKIVLDVHDFMCGDVKVKVLDEEELLVEGHVEKKEEGRSSVSSHSFRRYFSLPQHTDMAAITSVMSADGILTVTAPKIKTETIKENAINQTLASNYREKANKTQKHMESQTDSGRSSSTRKETCSCDFGFKRTADSSRFHSDSWDTFLPITRKGGFFQDSFFSGIHRDFDASIRKVLNAWNDADLQLADFWDDDDFHRSDRLGRYRQLRSRNLWSDNQAVTVTSDDVNYKIVLDMHDFVDGDVKVKLIGEELLVEAQSARSSYTFTRTFSLPESIDIMSITSVMSSDGILTITASKMESETQQKTTVIPISVKERHNASEVHSSTSSTTSGVSEEAASGQGISHTGQEEERKYARCYQENIDEDKTQTVASKISSNTQQSLQKQSSGITDFASTRISKSLEAKKTLGNLEDDFLPIARRGSFFQDSFFSDIRQGFDASVREILKKCNDSDLTVTDDISHRGILSRYRQLRSRNMREEDQAFSVLSDDATIKIVVDVHDFMSGDVKVKVVDEKELVVEGRVEKEEGSSSVSSHSFRRRFSLPHRTDTSRITPVMSSDGILTITALKMPEDSEECIVNSSTEEVQGSSEVQCSVFPTNETSSLHGECHDSNFDFVGRNQSKETIGTQESSAEEMANDSPAVSDEMKFYSLCRRSSIAMNEAFDNSCASCDFGTSSQDSLLSVIPEEEKDSETVEDSQPAIESIDLTDSQESVDIFDVEIPDLKDSQESVDIFYQRDLEATAEVFDLKDPEAVEILHEKDSQEAVAEAQNTSEAQNSKSSTTLDDVTEDAVSVQQKSKTIEEELAQFSWQNKYENKSTEQENFNSQTVSEGIPDSKMNQLAVTESCTDSLQSSRDSCIYQKEVVDTLGQLKLKDAKPSTSYTARTEKSTETVESLKGTRQVHRDSPEELLLITKRGNFFQDSFFLDTHQDFSAALRQVLDRCNEENFENDINLCYTDILERYRQLRSRALKEENQAVIVTSDKSCLKIIMDVYEFMSGAIQAKVVDEKELVIEGRVVKSEGTSSETSHSFRRRFSLPQYTDITSVMSLDGILTVTVIFQEGNTAKNFIETEAKCNITKEIFDSQSPSLSAEKRVLEAKTESQDGLNKNVTLQSEDFTSGTEMSKLASNFEENNRLKRFGQDCDREPQEDNSYNVTDTSMGTSSRFTSVSQSTSAVKSFPVTKRGLFFSHYFFRDSREDFQKAVREILSKWGEKSTDDDEMTCYRKLRARNMREDNQAVTSSEDEHHYKFVIDVQDFMDVGEISVKAVNERELVVEGHLEKKEDGSRSSKRFLRRFIVPGDIELEAVISVMSSDGVLKILAPKREVYNRKYVSTDEDMDDGDAAFTRKFTNGHRLADDFLGNRDSSSDDGDCRTFARQINDRNQVAFQEDGDEDFENEHMLNKETKMKTDKDFKFDIPSFSTGTRALHVDRRGVFTEDYFFANVRDSFSQAVREVLEKANEWTCRSDAMHNYRRLRQRNLKLETQAVGIIDDQDSHKIVMDVFDFIKGDVTVQLVKGKELLVEGQAEKLEGSRVSQVNFERRFALPELVDRDAISCVLSSDGILTITSKKRACEYRTSARGLSSERKSYGDRAGRWEDKKVKDSLADLEGPSSRSFSTGSRSRYHRSYAKQY